MTNLDLNLLSVFEALMAERSVSRAAARLGIGQPAASHALARLRAHWGDPLFVRTPRGMEPTTRAEEIAAQVLGPLLQIRGAIEGERPFDPATAERVFTISGGDYAGMIVMPRLVRRLRREAPRLDLRYRFIEKDAALVCLDADEIDVALGVFPDLPQHLDSGLLLEEHFVCLTDRDHPVCARGLDLEAFVGWPHLLITERGDATGVVDRILTSRGLHRRVALTVPHVMLVPMLLPGTDLIVTTGARAARMFAASGRLQMHEPPVPFRSWSLMQVWQRRRSRDAGLSWLRCCIHECATTDEAS